MTPSSGRSRSTRQLVSLYNTRVKRFAGLPNGSFAWLASGAQTGPSRDASVTLVAQPPVSGYVPFLGYFGGGPGNQSRLTQVRNPANGASLFFIKRGYSSNQCADPAATIPLAPGRALTADQMTQLYGSATPSLAQRIAFPACVAGTNASSVVINVSYRES